MAREIVVNIGTDGKVDIEAIGYSGNTCEQATKELIEALGGTVEEFRKKPEYHQQQTQQQTQKATR